jgi:hypothetical protein
MMLDPPPPRDDNASYPQLVDCVSLTDEVRIEGNDTAADAVHAIVTVGICSTLHKAIRIDRGGISGSLGVMSARTMRERA